MNKIKGLFIGFIWGILIHLIFSSVGKVSEESIMTFWDALTILIFILFISCLGVMTKEFLLDEHY